jgi:peptidoglycan/xylan/chitin deacetylase (PgdA/CDA1 family)
VLGGARALYVRWRRRTLYRRCLRGGVDAIVLRYHSVAPPERAREYLDPALAIPPTRFREQIAQLHGQREIVDLDTLAARLAAGTLDAPAAAITFDDGYRDNADTALPILRELDVPATFFVTTGPLTRGHGLWVSELWRLIPRLPDGSLTVDGGEPLEIPANPARRGPLRRRLTRRFAAMTLERREAALDRLASRAGLERGAGLEASFCRPEDLRALQAGGMTVGAHTRGHPHLESLPPEDHDAEVAGSREDLERLLDAPVRHFAYPNPGGTGRFPAPVRQAVERAGFTTACTSAPAPLQPGTDLLRLPRLGVYAGAQERQLFALLRRVDGQRRRRPSARRS